MTRNIPLPFTINLKTFLDSGWVYFTAELAATLSDMSWGDQSEAKKRVSLLYGSSRMQRTSWTMFLTSFTPISGSGTAGRPTSAWLQLRTPTLLTRSHPPCLIYVIADLLLSSSLTYILQKQWNTHTATKDTLQHGGNLQLMGRTSIGATFVELFPQVHKWKETFWEEEILVRKTHKI